MIRRPPRSTLFPTRRSSDLQLGWVTTPGEVVQLTLAGREVMAMDDSARKDAARARLKKHPLFGRVDRKSTRLNSSHGYISYAVFCLNITQHALIRLCNVLDR